MANKDTTESEESMKLWRNMSNVVISTVPVDGLASLGAKACAWTVILSSN